MTLTCVGVICWMSSEAIFFNIVVFPALSRPKSKIRSSLSWLEDFNFLSNDSKPWNTETEHGDFKPIFKNDNHHIRHVLTIWTKFDGDFWTMLLEEIFKFWTLQITTRLQLLFSFLYISVQWINMQDNFANVCANENQIFRKKWSFGEATSGSWIHVQQKWTIQGMMW